MPDQSVCSRRLRKTAGLAAAWAMGAACALCAWAGPLAFEDVTAQVGLAQPLANWRVAHGGAWGDANGDGRPDLYLGAFADRPLYRSENPPVPNPLFLQGEGGFSLSPDTAVRLEGRHARTTMALFADLDNDGDLDLIAGNNIQKPDACPTVLFANDGRGRFRDATPVPAPWPNAWSVRNLAALDVNDDGLLDLLLTDGSYASMGGRGRLLILENQGKWTFEEVGQRYGLPADHTAGLGLAVGDANNDGRMDIFVAGDNRLFVSTPDGRFAASLQAFEPVMKGEYLPCGAAWGDLNGDDLLDLVLTVHADPGEYHVYANQGVQGGMPQLKRVSQGRFPEKSPISGLLVKAGQVCVADMDNDGRPDVMISVVMDAGGGRALPFVLRNVGSRGGEIRLESPPVESALGYHAVAPVADYDRDGRLDIMLPAWDEQPPNRLLRNVTAGGHWVAVSVKGDGRRRNTMGIGSVVRVYETGKAGDASASLGRRDLTIGNGYSSGEEAIAYLGLGAAERCDLVVQWGASRITNANVAADQYIAVKLPPQNE